MSDLRLSNEVLNPEYAKKFMAARIGLDKLVAKKGYQIVDVNVSGIYTSTEFNAFKDAEDVYDDLRENLPPSLTGGIVDQQLTADMVMAREVLAKPVPFDEFIQAATGFVPEMIPSQTIQSLKDRLNKLLLDFSAINYDKSAAEDYREKFVLAEEKDIKPVFNRAQELARIAISQYIELPDSFPHPEYFQNETESWTALASTDDKGNPTLRVNTHPARGYTVGKILQLGLHEFAHSAQMSAWRDQIRNGELSPVVGITSVTSPETTHMEAVAAFTQSDLGPIAGIPEEPLILIQDTYRELCSSVYHNAALKINSGVPEEQVIRDAAADLPFEDKRRITGLVRASRDNPMARADLIRYPFVERLMKPLIAMPDSPQKNQAIAKIYRNSLTLDQLNWVIAGALSGQAPPSISILK